MTQFSSATAQLNSHVFSDDEKEARFMQYNRNQNDKQTNECKQVRSKTLLEIDDMERRAELMIRDGILEEERICLQIKERNKSREFGRDDQATNNIVRQRLDAMYRKANAARSAYQQYIEQANSCFTHTAQFFSLLHLRRHTRKTYMISTLTFVGTSC